MPGDVYNKVKSLNFTPDGESQIDFVEIQVVVLDEDTNAIVIQSGGDDDRFVDGVGLANQQPIGSFTTRDATMLRDSGNFVGGNKKGVLQFTIINETGDKPNQTCTIDKVMIKPASGNFEAAGQGDDIVFNFLSESDDAQTNPVSWADEV